MAIVVVNWNGRDYLEACLAGLGKQTYPNHEVVVVDNGSTDGSAELVEECFPGARLIRNTENRGFGAANNQGIRATHAPYVATLNNDAVPEPGWLATLVATVEGDPAVGSVASKMVFAHDPATIDSCGIALDRAGIAWDLWGGRPASVADQPREVFGPCAGAALYRRAMLDDVGLFDEDFFAYLEDVDLAWRARLRGWRCLLAPDALVRHVHSGTLGDNSPRKRSLLGRNKIWTLAKCLPSGDPRGLALAIGYDLAAVAARIARGDWQSVWGRLAALARLGQVAAKRRSVQTRRTVDHATLRSAYAPVAPPWRVPDRYRHLGTGVRVDQKPFKSPEPTLRQRLRRVALRIVGTLLAGRPQARRRLASPSTPRILVLRPDHLGDVLLSRPAIEWIQASLPAAHLTVAAGPWATSALQGLECRVAAFPFPGFTRAPKGSPLAPYVALLSLAGRLARERFDAAVVLRPDHWWGALVCAMAGIPIRVGQDGPEVRYFLTHPVSAAREPAPATAARMAEALIRALGSRPIAGPGPVAFAPSPAARAAMEQWIQARFGDRRPIVALHPGAGAQVKLWPAHRWVSVLRALVDNRVGVVLTGGPEDGALVTALASRLGREAPLALDLSWDELGALYAALDLVLGVDSGPLHLAAAVGTPTVRIYGPSDPVIYGPAGPPGPNRALVGRLGCAPCGNLVAPPCGYRCNPPCLATVSVGDVLEAVRVTLSGAAVR